MKNNLMKLMSLCGLLTAILMTTTAYATPAAALKEVQGEVFVQSAGSAADAWKAVTVDTDVNNGDSVKTGNGSCALTYTDQATFRLGANTSLTIQQKPDANNVDLKLGHLMAKINSAKVTRPFQVVTPIAIGCVRGTDVDFDFNDQGAFTADLHEGGPVQITNEQTSMDMTLTNGNKITVQFNKEKGELTVTNSCSSSGSVSFSLMGKTYSLDKCGKQTLNTVETAAGAPEVPGTDQNDQGNENTPNENSPVTP
ncbi:MAG: FecR domain-containing protein [Candidatus Omnitrophota bacterium]